MVDTVKFDPKIYLEEQYPQAFIHILRKDRNWRSKSNMEKLEVVNLVRKDLLLSPVTENTGIMATLQEIEDQILFLKVMKAPQYNGRTPLLQSGGSGSTPLGATKLENSMTVTNVNVARTSVVLTEDNKKVLIFWLVGTNPIGFDIESEDLAKLMDIFQTRDTSTIQYARIRTGDNGALEALGHITEDKWFDFPVSAPVQPEVA